MSAKYKTIIVILFLLAVAALGTLYICYNDIIVLNPKGLIGEKQRSLMYIACALMLIVVIPVYILAFVFSIKFRNNKKDADYRPDWEHSYVAEAAWWGVPFVIILVLAVITYKSSHELSPFKPIQSDVKPLEIQAVALEWKWLFIYPEQGVATVNYIQFPTNTPLNFEITADAPMNSFWIPQLGGQIYAMPSMRSQMHLIADKPGQYWGRSANFSGTGFAGMRFAAIASSQEEFNDWVSEAKSSGESLDFQSYQDLVEPTQNNPVTLYRLSDTNLFDQILMKYEPQAVN